MSSHLIATARALLLGLPLLLSSCSLAAIPVSKRESAKAVDIYACGKVSDEHDFPQRGKRNLLDPLQCKRGLPVSYAVRQTTVSSAFDSGRRDDRSF